MAAITAMAVSTAVKTIHPSLEMFRNLLIVSSSDVANSYNLFCAASGWMLRISEILTWHFRPDRHKHLQTLDLPLKSTQENIITHRFLQDW